jgi:hypothetical protein
MGGRCFNKYRFEPGIPSSMLPRLTPACCCCLQELAAKLSIPPQHMAQLHTGFLIYSSKRSELTAQMQATMTQLQQLLTPVVQEQQQPAKQQQQQPAKTQQDQQVLHGPQHADSNDSSTSSITASAPPTAAACQPSQPSQLSRAPAAADMLENLEQADVLLQQLSRQVWCLREASRCLIFQWCNVLDPLQLSLSAVNAWPFIVQPPPVLEVLVRQEVARQQPEDSGVDADEEA